MPLTSANVADIRLIHSILPAEPEEPLLSPDGGRAARRSAGRLEILDIVSGESLSSFEVNFPDCSFGYHKYYEFNQDGSFIAVISLDAIQVWQVGGGLLFEKLHNLNLSGGAVACGPFLPQVALSADGRLLAISALDIVGGEIRQIFQVIDVFANETIYEWDGDADSPHGNLFGFPALGFSPDGKILQTFDPTRFILASENMHQAFRFWSTETWQGVRPSGVIRASLDAGRLLFARSDSGKVKIFDKLTGKKVAEIPLEGCALEMPCETVFSPDGTKAAILPRDNGMQYRRALVYPTVQVWDIVDEEMIREWSGKFLNLDGALVSNLGELVTILAGNGEMSLEADWWILTDLFQGLQQGADDRIQFTPTWSRASGSDGCRYCDTCRLDLGQGTIVCQAGVAGDYGQYTLEVIDGEWWLAKQAHGQTSPLGKLSLEAEAAPGNTRIRLLAISEEWQTAFYCRDVDYRPRACVIDHLGGHQIVEALANISFVRLSPDGKKAAFIDASTHTLYLYDFETRKLARTSHYQARAVAANPEFSPDGLTLYCLVENLRKYGDFSMEVMDVENRKVIRRVSLSKAAMETPTSLVVNAQEDLWVIADRAGDIYLSSPEQGQILRQWSSGQIDLTGLALSPDERLLISMSGSGLINFWGAGR